MIKIAEGRGRRRKGEGTGAASSAIFGTMYGELYVEGARSSSLPTSLPLILSSSPSPSLFTHSLQLSWGAQPQRRPHRLDMSSYFQLNSYGNYFFIQLDFCFAYLCERVCGEVAVV